MKYCSLRFKGWQKKQLIFFTFNQNKKIITSNFTTPIGPIQTIKLTYQKIINTHIQRH